MAGHDLRLNRRTEKTTPKPRPRVDFIKRLERHRSHCMRSIRTLSAFACLSNQWPPVGGFDSSRERAMGHSRQAYLLVQKCLADWSRDRARGWWRNRGLGHLEDRCVDLWLGERDELRQLRVSSRQYQLAVERAGRTHLSGRVALSACGMGDGDVCAGGSRYSSSKVLRRIFEKSTTPLHALGRQAGKLQ